MNDCFPQDTVAALRYSDGRIALWVKTPPGVQELLVEAEPARFFRPPYVGPSGWIGIRLDGVVDWGEVADSLADGYRLAAPKKLAAQFDPGAAHAARRSGRRAAPHVRPSPRGRRRVARASGCVSRTIIVCGTR